MFDETAMGSTQRHLAADHRVNLGAYYTRADIVHSVWRMLAPYLKADSVVLDSSCGYGSFLAPDAPMSQKMRLVGADIDKQALDEARKQSGARAELHHANALCSVTRAKYGIESQAHLVIIGNPPYNDRTSQIRHDIKVSARKPAVDADLATRDLGLSFLRSFNKLQADVVCVLHPLSYLIKPANLRALAGFARHYALIDARVISSAMFDEASGKAFPIVIALYRRGGELSESKIRKFRFAVTRDKKFALDDFDFIGNYLRKYPRKTDQAHRGIWFWTMRDINALMRNRTFVSKWSANAIAVENELLDYYVYVDVFKANLARVPYYFGNCEVMLDNSAFDRIRETFRADALTRHPSLARYFGMNSVKSLSMAASAQRRLNKYFHELLGSHHVASA